MAITSMILGIVSLLVAWIIAILGWGASITALVLGILALRKGQSKGMALTGIITGAIGILCSLSSSIIGVIIMTSVMNSSY
ncbi:hypothetical protein BMH28_15300 [Leucobacter sp. OLCS4]|nr:hypothetical protein BMH28_15300 [Leucobacter sp. OLCS4]PII98192.1 hypothetical protein BMH29_08435 [Leucobacter sp. OLDS2]